MSRVRRRVESNTWARMGAELPIDHQRGLGAADAECETLARGLGHRSKLEERMAPGLGKVFLGRVIDTDPTPP
jgi:hypothetical protein